LVNTYDIEFTIGGHKFEPRFPLQLALKSKKLETLSEFDLGLKGFYDTIQTAPALKKLLNNDSGYIKDSNPDDVMKSQFDERVSALAKAILKRAEIKGLAPPPE
jgi:hypothetical protein